MAQGMSQRAGCAAKVRTNTEKFRTKMPALSYSAATMNIGKEFAFPQSGSVQNPLGGETQT